MYWWIYMRNDRYQFKFLTSLTLGQGQTDAIFEDLSQEYYNEFDIWKVIRYWYKILFSVCYIHSTDQRVKVMTLFIELECKLRPSNHVWMQIFLRYKDILLDDRDIIWWSVAVWWRRKKLKVQLCKVLSEVRVGKRRSMFFLYACSGKKQQKTVVL